MSNDQRAPQWGDDPAGVTKQELLSTAIAVFVIGCLTGWAVFGNPNLPEIVLSNGSVAEWVAAVATSVIGLLAWRISRQNHQHQLYITTLAEIRERKKELYAIASVIDDLSVVQATMSAWIIDKPNVDDASVGSLKMCCDSALMAIRGCAFTGAGLTSFSIQELYNIEMLKSQLVRLEDGMRLMAQAIGETTAADQREIAGKWFKALQDLAKRINEYAEPAYKAAIIHRRAAKRQLKSFESQIAHLQPPAPAT